MEECNIYNNNELKDDDNKENDITSTYLSAFWHGLGLFGESYLLFSVGTLRPLWEALYPACFDAQNNNACANPYLSYKSITYSVVLGVMAGMIALGILANTIGRRRGSIITASLMAFGAVCLSLSSIFLSGNPSVLFPVMSLSLFVFGVGVGGEYPLSASSASERAMATMKRRRRIELDHEEKMKRLLMVSSSHYSGGDDNPTPLRGNLSKSYNNDELYGREDSMLQVYTNMSPRSPSGTTMTTTMATTTPWQTLESKAPSVAYNNNDNNHQQNVGNAQHSVQLTPVVEESYGDVPLSPTNQTDNYSLSTYNSSLRTRGREVLLVFSMQGMGILANSLILTFLLMVARKNGDENNNNNNNDNYDNDNDDGGDDNFDDAGDNYNYDVDANYEPSTLLNIWRITYATGAGILIYVLVSRISHLTESEVWAEDREQREEERRERCHREAGVGFRPPQEQPYDNDKRKAAESNSNSNNDNEGGETSKQQGQPVISPTMSSITMKSEFDMLGSTNLDGCKIVPVMSESEDDSRGGGNKMKRSSEEMLLFRHYGVRLFGTSVTWLLWDIAYYGNKLFQSSFLIALTGEDASLVDIMGASAVNAFVALLGYYAAAAVVDDPDCGRVALQQTGFIITGTLFLLCGCLNERLSSTWLVVMYFGSSFFGQCGPNCTTFLIPCEVFPTNMRAMCHGISASAGKLGALIASILFNFVGERELFLFSGYASFAASLITFLTIPETTTLDLYEIDKQWHKVLNNERYEGPATDPRHLSFYERNQNRFCCSR